MSVIMCVDKGGAGGFKPPPPQILQITDINNCISQQLAKLIHKYVIYSMTQSSIELVVIGHD